MWHFKSTLEDASRYLPSDPNSGDTTVLDNVSKILAIVEKHRNAHIVEGSVIVDLERIVQHITDSFDKLAMPDEYSWEKQIPECIGWISEFNKRLKGALVDGGKSMDDSMVGRTFKDAIASEAYFTSALTQKLESLLEQHRDNDPKIRLNAAVQMGKLRERLLDIEKKELDFIFFVGKEVSRYKTNLDELHSILLSIQKSKNTMHLLRDLPKIKKDLQNCMDAIESIKMKTYNFIDKELKAAKVA